MKVLVTGPVEHIAEWCRAARDAGWEAVEFPLIDVVQLDVDPHDALGADPRFDWICVTSANAIPFVERVLLVYPRLRDAAIACVGDRATARLSKIGHPTAFDPSRDAKQLAALVAARAPAGARVLWPRGDRSDDLAVELRAHGFEVVDPIVYVAKNRPPAEPPKFDAVFFASPSAVRAWQEAHSRRPVGRAVAIAIGRTTFAALLAETDHGFFDILSLPHPEPETFGFVLQHLDPQRNP
jgi:uroporphyrinogen-III synthase